MVSVNVSMGFHQTNDVVWGSHTTALCIRTDMTCDPVVEVVEAIKRCVVGSAPTSDFPDFQPGTWPQHPEEEDRLQVLRELDVLDSAAERAFDNIVQWGRKHFNVPICLISLVDSNRQWFKGMRLHPKLTPPLALRMYTCVCAPIMAACYGLDVTQTDRDSAFCAHAILPGAPDVFEVCPRQPPLPSRPDGVKAHA